MSENSVGRLLFQLIPIVNYDKSRSKNRFLIDSNALFKNQSNQNLSMLYLKLTISIMKHL